jgi:hypothetical protein
VARHPGGLVTSHEEAGERSYPTARFGNTELPPQQTAALRRATRLEIVTILYMFTGISVVFLTMGSSQAMKTG